MKRWGAGILAIVCVLVLAVGGASAQTYSATVGGLGGVWYTMYTGIAELVKEKDPGVIIRVVPGGGLIAVQKVGEGASEFGFGFPWTVADAVAGRWRRLHPGLRARPAGRAGARRPGRTRRRYIRRSSPRPPCTCTSCPARGPGLCRARPRVSR